MLKNGRLRLHARVVKINVVHLQVFHGVADYAFHIFAVTRMHEINPLAKRLVVIKDGHPEEIGNEPIRGIGLFRKERFIGDRAADIDADADAVFVEQVGELLCVLFVLLLRFPAESLIKVDNGHRHAEAFEPPDRLFAVLLAVVLFLPRRPTANPVAEDGHTVPVPHDDERLGFEPRGRGNSGGSLPGGLAAGGRGFERGPDDSCD